MNEAYRLPARLRRFARDERGSVIALSALLLPIIGGACLFGLDHMRASQQIAAMQRAADAAALAAVRQMPFVARSARGDADAQDETLTAIAAGLVRSTLDERLPQATTIAGLTEEGTVRVSLTASYGSLFGEIGAFGDNPFTVHSSAQTFGGQNVCFLALGLENEDSSIEMQDYARLTADTCEIYSGSEAPDSVSVEDSAKMTASFICSAGGYDGSDSSYSTVPATDCTQIEDPLANRPPPPMADDACDHDDVTYETGSHTMNPGVYCGKTDLKSGANVTMNPGIYVFRDGELHLHGSSSLSGTEVGLYFDDRTAFFKFMDEGEVKLSAPTSGPMAGMLIAARPVCRNNGALVSVTVGGRNGRCRSGREFLITSSNVHALLGTIHLPNDTLSIDTTMPVSEEAAFTIIVVGQVILERAPRLVLNTDYDATNVPVPDGFREGGQTVSRLVR